MTIQSISEISDNRVTIAGVPLTITKSTRGSNHVIYFFEGDASLDFEGHSSVTAAEIVLRRVSQLITPGKKGSALPNEAEKAYVYLQANEIPVPKRYLVTPNGWVLERMAEQVDSSSWKDVTDLDTLTTKQKTTLLFAQQILTKSAVARQKGDREFVGDFYPRNVMLNHEGKPHVVDFARCEKSRLNLFDSLKSWANANHVVFHYLITAFPEGIKKEMIGRWNDRG